MGGDVRPLGWVAAGAADVAESGQRPARLQRRRVPLGQHLLPPLDGSLRAAQRLHDGQGAAEAGQADRGEGRAVQGRVALRTRRLAGRSAERRPDRGVLRLERHHLPLRPQDEHLQAIRQRGEEADRSRRRQAGRTQERRRDAHVLRAAERRQQQAPARGRCRRLGDGLDRHERPHDQGHLAQDRHDQAHPVLRRRR